jgi:protein tyrosine phosphatase (PTP) superfamily phosphohydrolase (DUF442 family)
MKVKNYLKISPMLSSSGQPAREDFSLIAKQGFQVVINLSMPDSKSALSDEGYLVTSKGMTYIHIPVPFDAPELSHLHAFYDAMEAFSAKKVWVHCALNYRASAFLYLYNRLVKKKTKEDARRYIFPDWEPNDTWSAFIKRCEVGISTGSQ